MSIKINKQSIGTVLVVTSMLGFFIGTIALHIWTAQLAYVLGGFVGALIAFIAPVFSEIFMFFFLLINYGIGNYHAYVVLGLVGLSVTFSIGSRLFKGTSL